MKIMFKLWHDIVIFVILTNWFYLVETRLWVSLLIKKKLKVHKFISYLEQNR